MLILEAISKGQSLRRFEQMASVVTPAEPHGFKKVQILGGEKLLEKCR